MGWLARSISRLFIWLLVGIGGLIGAYLRLIFGGKSAPTTRNIPAKNTAARSKEIGNSILKRFFLLTPEKAATFRRFKRRGKDKDPGYGIVTSTNFIPAFSGDTIYSGLAGSSVGPQVSHVAWRRFVRNRGYSIMARTAHEELEVAYDPERFPQSVYLAGNDERRRVLDITFILGDIHVMNERLALAGEPYIFPVITNPVPLRPKAEFIDRVLRLPPPRDS